MLQYAITDSRLFAGDEQALLAACMRLMDTVDYLQVREREWNAARLERFCRNLLAATAPSKAKLLVNHRLDVAMAAGAHGVHLRSGKEELTAGEVRAAYSVAGLPQPVVSVSCHTGEECALAASGKADLVLFGPVFGKFEAGILVVPATGLAPLQQAVVAAAPVPVLALGGVTAANTQDCLAAGAAGIAGIRTFFTP